MATVKKRYHIVEFKTALPYKSCHQLVCVPRTWMTYHDVKNDIAVVAYPRQQASNIDIKNMNKFQAGWGQFVVKIIHSTNNYAEARRSLKLFNDTPTEVTVEEKTTDHGSTSKRIPKWRIDEDYIPASQKPKSGTKKPLKRLIKNTVKEPQNKTAKVRKLTEEDSVRNGSIASSSNLEHNSEESSADSKTDVSDDLKAIERILDDSKSILRYLKKDNAVQSKLTEQLLDILNTRNDKAINKESIKENSDSESENELDTPNVSTDGQLNKLEIKDTFTIKKENQLQFY